MTCLAEDKEFVQKSQKKVGDAYTDIPNCIGMDGKSQTLKHDGKVLMIAFWIISIDEYIM